MSETITVEIKEEDFNKLVDAGCEITYVGPHDYFSRSYHLTGKFKNGEVFSVIYGSQFIPFSSVNRTEPFYELWSQKILFNNAFADDVDQAVAILLAANNGKDIYND